MVRIAYDETMLYVAAEMFDAEPSLLWATELRRDNALDSDDRFTVLFDTFDDNRNGFVFRVNELGTKYDATVRDEGRLRADWDEQWEAAARVTETGWAVEMAIPFKVLRFPGGEGAQEWGINFERVIKRKNETAHWSGWSRDYQYPRTGAGEQIGLGWVRVAPRPGANQGSKGLSGCPPFALTRLDMFLTLPGPPKAFRLLVVGEGGQEAPRLIEEGRHG